MGSDREACCSCRVFPDPRLERRLTAANPPCLRNFAPAGPGRGTWSRHGGGRGAPGDRGDREGGGTPFQPENAGWSKWIPA